MNFSIATPDDVPVITEELHKAPYVCVDTEFHAERRYTPDLHLVQIHVPNRKVWFLDPHQDDVLVQVGPALTSQTWIVHGGQQDLRILSAHLGSLPRAVYDTQYLAGLCHNTFPAGYAALQARFIGRQLAKTATLSDWSKRPLSEQQLTYAAEDVLHLDELYLALKAQLTAMGRLAVADQAGQELLSRLHPEPTKQWFRIPGARHLSRPSAAVLRELAAWRERRARERNQPARSIISDGVLLQISKQCPAAVEELFLNRRIPRGTIKKHGNTIVGYVKKALDIASDAYPRTLSRNGAADIQYHWLGVLAEVLSAEQNVAKGLIFPDHLLFELATTPPNSKDDLLKQLGWRKFMADRLWDALCGRLALISTHGQITLKETSRATAP